MEMPRVRIVQPTKCRLYYIRKRVAKPSMAVLGLGRICSSLPEFAPREEPIFADYLRNEGLTGESKATRKRCNPPISLVRSAKRTPNQSPGATCQKDGQEWDQRPIVPTCLTVSPVYESACGQRK